MVSQGHFAQQKTVVQHLLQAALVLAQSQNSTAVEELLDAEQRLAQEKLYAVVCGEYKQGKSQLINALLNEPDLLPVDADIATRLVTTISYGPEERITVILGELGKGEPVQIGRTDIPAYASEQNRSAHTTDARLLVIELPNSRLRDGLVIVDTPGIGGLNIEHTAITQAFLPNADAVLYVNEVDSPISSEDIAFLKRVVRYTQQIIFVVTKRDRRADYEVAVENNRTKLAPVLGRIGSLIPIVSVSSSLKMAAGQTGNLTLEERSNFAALDAELWRLLNEHRGYVLLMGALSRLLRNLRLVGVPLRTEIEALERTTPAEVAELDAEIEAARQRIQELLSEGASWQLRLTDGFEDIRTRAFDTFQEQVASLRKRFNDYLSDKAMIAKPQTLVAILQQDVNDLVYILDEQVRSEVGELYADLTALTDLQLRQRDPKLSVTPAPLDLSSSNAKPRGIVNQIVTTYAKAQVQRSAGRNLGAMLGGVAGGAVGLVGGPVGASVGAMLGGLVGGVLGDTAGALIGLRGAIERQQQELHSEQRQAIEKHLRPAIDERVRICDHALRDMLRQAQRTLRDEFQRKLRLERQIQEQARQRCQAARTLSEKQATMRLQELRRPLVELERIEREGAALVERLVAEHQSASGSSSQSNGGQNGPDSSGSSVDRGDWADG